MQFIHVMDIITRPYKIGKLNCLMLFVLYLSTCKQVERNISKMQQPGCDDFSNNECDSEVPNRKRVNVHLSEDAKQIILNVYNSLKSEYESGCVKKTADLTKINYYTVRRIVINGVTPKKPRVDSGKSRVVNDFEADVIRRKVYSMYKENMLPSLRILYERLISDQCEINCSLQTLHRVLRKIGFRFKLINRRQVIMESRRICEWRFKYLSSIKNYRDLNRPIIYLDETWYDTHDIVKKSWTDDSLNCSVDVPVSRGKRVIILHAGSDQGWVNNALLLSARNVKDANLDYYDNMSAEIFEPWFKNTLILNLSPNSVIVMDNASYHSRLSVKVPNMTSKKSDIVDYLYKNDLFFEDSYTKKQLLEVVKSKPVEKQYVCDLIASEFGHSVLRLPPYYCVFNPIELVWGQLKSKIRRKNVSPANSASVIDLIKSEISEITLQNWSDSVRHVIDIEKKYYDVQNVVEDFIIHLNSDTDSDSDESIIVD